MSESGASKRTRIWDLPTRLFHSAGHRAIGTLSVYALLIVLAVQFSINKGFES
jgi:cytochrome b